MVITSTHFHMNFLSHISNTSYICCLCCNLYLYMHDLNLHTITRIFIYTYLYYIHIFNLCTCVCNVHFPWCQPSHAPPLLDKVFSCRTTETRWAAFECRRLALHCAALHCAALHLLPTQDEVAICDLWPWTHPLDPLGMVTFSNGTWEWSLQLWLFTLGLLLLFPSGLCCFTERFHSTKK